MLIDLNADQTGSFGVEFGIDDELRQLVSAEGGEFSMGDVIGGFGANAPEGVVTERTEGDMQYTVVRTSFSDLAEFRQIVSEGGGDGGDIDVIWEDNRVTIDALFEQEDAEGGLAGLGLDGISDFADNFFSASVIVSMPGEVLEHNADRVLSDGRLQWDTTLGGGDVQVRAVSSLDGASSFPAWALLLIVLIAVAVVVWLYSNMRKRRSVAAVEAAGMVGAEAPPAPTDWSTPPAAPVATEDD